MKCLRQDLLSVSKLRFLVYVVCLAFWVSPVSAETPSSSRPWAERIHNQHLSNFHRVSDDLYRSAQPSIKGFKELQRLGIRTIINLRSRHSDKAALKHTTLRYEEIKMTATLPNDEQAVQFLRIVSDRENGPFLVHCHHGSDRTGTMTAIYRVIIQGWSKDEAIAEMASGEFGFHKIWGVTLVPFLRKINVDDLKQKAGLNRGGPVI
jgi:protein tyrosine/serine phosphatase